MPWLETAPVEERNAFITDHHLGLYAMNELCARYGVSRKTGYKWLARYDVGGRAALADRSRAPHHCPQRIPADVAERICAARRSHPSWGPGMLLQWLARHDPSIVWPASSTAGDLLARRGLVKKRRRRRPHFHPGVVAPVTHAPNDLWTADFKGHFRTRDGVYCYPLTIADLHTRYLLTCQGLLSTKGVGVRASFERAFRCYGLPRAIRTDNGVPFATTGIHGLSQLNVWWMRLGIQHQRSRPATPQDNAAHERMHKTLRPARSGRRAAPWRPSSAPSTPSAPSTTTNGRISICAAARPVSSIVVHPGPIPSACHRSSIPGISSSSASPMPAPSASSTGCCSLPMPSNNTT